MSEMDVDEGFTSQGSSDVGMSPKPSGTPSREMSTDSGCSLFVFGSLQQQLDSIVDNEDERRRIRAGALGLRFRSPPMKIEGIRQSKRRNTGANEEDGSRRKKRRTLGASAVDEEIGNASGEHKENCPEIGNGASIPGFVTPHRKKMTKKEYRSNLQLLVAGDPAVDRRPPSSNRFGTSIYDLMPSMSPVKIELAKPNWDEVKHLMELPLEKSEPRAFCQLPSMKVTRPETPYRSEREKRAVEKINLDALNEQQREMSKKRKRAGLSDVTNSIEVRRKAGAAFPKLPEDFYEDFA